MIERLIKRSLNADVFGLAFVFSATLIFVHGVVSSVPDVEPSLYYWDGVVALVIGLGLGKSKSKPIQASAGIVAVGAGGVWILGARLGVPLIRLGQETFALIPQIVSAIRLKTGVDPSALVEAWEVIRLFSAALAVRFQIWIIGLTQNSSADDALTRNLIWLLWVWLIAAWTGWHAMRRDATVTMLPALLTLVSIASYSGEQTVTVWGLAMSQLLLMGIWTHKNHTRVWEARQVDYSESIIYDSTQAIILLALFVGALSFITPSITLREAREFLRAQNSNEVADALGIETNPDPPDIFTVKAPSLPRQHLLGGGSASSDRIVMTIRTGELSPRASAEIAARAPRHYWRSVIYDRYIGGGWVTSGSLRQNYPANTPLIPGVLSEYRQLRFDVQMERVEGRIIWTGILASADIPLTVEWRLKPTSNLLADQSALLEADIFAAPTTARAYTATAFLPEFTLAQLRAASADYPEEIRARYLDLPPTIPPRVLALAHEITSNMDNPYDKASAIESYLRANYPYDLDIPAPPSDRDVVDFFLFDLKKGYCDYYASAMVVLARASGLPARFVSGYAPGEYDAPNAQYIVRERHAHSWVEVYFPQIGWIEFEPTASIDEITRAENQSSLPVTQEETYRPPKKSFTFTLRRPGSIVFPLLFLAFIAAAYFLWFERWTLRRYSPSVAIALIHQRLYRIGRPLAGERTRSETAMEFALNLNRNLRITTSPRYEKLSHELQHEINALTAIHQSSLFRNVRVTLGDFHNAWRSWTRIRWRLLIVMAVHKLNNLRAARDPQP